MSNPHPDSPHPEFGPRRRVGTRDFALDAAEQLSRSRTPFCLTVTEPDSTKVYIMTTFRTRRQCEAAIHAIENYADDQFGPEWQGSPA